MRVRVEETTPPIKNQESRVVRELNSVSKRANTLHRGIRYFGCEMGKGKEGPVRVCVVYVLKSELATDER